jgi:dephospho-CoA kinase
MHAPEYTRSMLLFSADMAKQRRSDHIIVGVTGGIGSGKTTVCRLFEEMGRSVFWADVLARTIMDTDSAVRANLRSAFGKSVFGDDGRLERKILAERVFSRPEELLRLNQIVHPAVFALISTRIQSLPASKRSPYVLVEAALIFETGFDSRLDYTVVVEAEERVRIRRIMERDGLTESEILNRMRSQMPPAEKNVRADFVILNDGTAKDLLPRVRLLDTILSALAVPGP